MYQDNQHLDDFYGRGIAGSKFGSAYPGFWAFLAIMSNKVSDDSRAVFDDVKQLVCGAT